MTIFSDGVIAVIITVMILDHKVPAHDLRDQDALRKVTPVLIIYALSVVEVGICWVNHPNMVDGVERVSHGTRCPNHSFLLAPFTPLTS